MEATTLRYSLLFLKIGGILSGAGALFTLRLLKALNVSSEVITILEILNIYQE